MTHWPGQTITGRCLIRLSGSRHRRTGINKNQHSANVALNKLILLFGLQEGLTDDDYDMYYEIWQQFDPNGTQYIKYGQLSDFLDVLESPLQIHKPNKYKIISMDIPICKVKSSRYLLRFTAPILPSRQGDLCYCVDVLDALTKDFFARKGNPVEETAELGEVTAQVRDSALQCCQYFIMHWVLQADRPGYDPISSTLWRQREEYCARMIQTVWRRNYKVSWSASLLGGDSPLPGMAH